MSDSRPNVVLIVVDQMRSDALSINSVDQFISTPTLDMMASQGYNFENAYSTVPSCVPARVGLLTGLNPEHSGRVGYEDEVNWDYENTLPAFFRNEGYQTECIGKMHVYPSRKRLGFDHVRLHDGYLHVDRKYDKRYGEQFENSSDYLKFLKSELGFHADMIDDGLHCNSWQARPWMHEEYLHPTNWVVSEAIDFLKTKDPTVPFFLKLSFEKPHAPLNPPKYYFDQYMQRLTEDIDLHIGNWEEKPTGVPDITALKGCLKPDAQKRMLAGYYGLVSHIDEQINRLLIALKEFRHDKDTIICFVSDHGDQLGEHYLFRKGYPYQGSIHIPLFIYDPGNLIEAPNHKIRRLVQLQDIFPTLVDLALKKEAKTDGMSMKSLLFDCHAGWRKQIHGEHSLGEDSSQFILTEKYKFIWYPVKNEYQLFDLQLDPFEQNNLVNIEKFSYLVNEFKENMVQILQHREEGFVQNNQLVQVPLAHITATLKHRSTANE